MSIKTNHNNESLTPDSGTLVINAEGAIKLPIGDVSARPAGVKGLVRIKDDTVATPEYFDGVSWQLVTNKDYVDSANQTLQEQIDSIISNLDPAALDSLTEIVAAFQNADTDLATTLTTLQNSLDNLFSASTTDDLAEGTSNLYYTDARVRNALSATDGISYDNSAGQFTLTDTGVVSGSYGSASEVPVFTVDDNGRITSATTTAVAGVASINYDIATGQITVGTSAGTDFTAIITLDPFTTDELTEGVNNLYYTDERVGNYLTDNSYATETYVDTKTFDLENTIVNLTLDDLSDVSITTPTDGQVLVYDVVTGEFRTQTQAMSVITRTFTADGLTYDFDIQTTVSSIHNMVVTVNGIQQEPIYSFILTNGHIVTFDEAPESGDKIQVKILTTSAQTDRPRPRITNIIYGTINNYTTITITATDITYGTGVKIGDKTVTRIDYINANQIQAMIETTQMSNSFWNNPQDLTLIDTSGNEYVFYDLISYGITKPHFTSSNEYIGSFSGGDSINFALPINNAVTITIDPAYAGESAISWLSVSGSNIVGTAPQNSTPSRYEIQVTASNGSVNITKNFWLLVV
jgi:hypothetical protein